MLDWFNDTPIGRAIANLKARPEIKKKADWKIKEEQKRTITRTKRKKKNKLKKRMALNRG